MVPADLSVLLPELTIACLVLAVLVLDLATGPVSGRTAMGSLALLGILLALALFLARWGSGDLWIASFSGALVSDRYSRLLDIAVLTGAAGVSLLALGSATRSGSPGAYFSLVLTAVLGMLAAVGADDLPVLCLGLALAFLPIQILAGWGAAASGREAALRLGHANGLAWCLFAVGTAVVWAAAGTVDYGQLAQLLEEGVERGAVLAGLAMILGAVALLAGVAPFHQPAIDVHQGMEPSTGALLAGCAAPSALAGGARLLIYVFAPLASSWTPGIAAVAALGAVVGALLAAAQDRLRRLVAALVCAHVGSVLLGVASGTEEGLAAALFLLCVQGAAMLGLAGLLQVACLGPGARLPELAGLARRHPPLALALACCLLALAGLPPVAGFAGRLLAYRAAAAAGLGWFLAPVMISQVVAAWATIRLLAATATGGREGAPGVRVSPAPAAVLALATAALVGLGLYPEPLIEACRQAARSLL